MHPDDFEMPGVHLEVGEYIAEVQRRARQASTE
jgi:hypothetical protein